MSNRLQGTCGILFAALAIGLAIRSAKVCPANTGMRREHDASPSLRRVVGDSDEGDGPGPDYDREVGFSTEITQSPCRCHKGMLAPPSFTPQTHSKSSGAS